MHIHKARQLDSDEYEKSQNCHARCKLQRHFLYSFIVFTDLITEYTVLLKYIGPIEMICILVGPHKANSILSCPDKWNTMRVVR